VLKEIVSMFWCCTNKNEKLFGIDGEGCDAEITISSGVIKKSSKGKEIMSGYCIESKEVMFEVGGKELNSKRCMGVAQPGAEFYLK
jgi:hypothetical protein